MHKYQFKTQEFGVVDNEFHLLRNGFNYKRIKFSEINLIEIERGKEVNNWIIIFLLGLILVIPGIYVLINISRVFLYDDYTARQMWGILMLLFMPVVGGYFIYSSLQMTTVLRIYYNGNLSKRFTLRALVKNGDIENFKRFIRENKTCVVIS